MISFLKSLLQHHNSKASVLPFSAFFMVHLSHPYIAHSLAGYLHLVCLWEFSEAFRASLVALTVKNLPAMWETSVLYLGLEDPLEKRTATHSSILDWRIPWTEGAGEL